MRICPPPTPPSAPADAVTEEAIQPYSEFGACLGEPPLQQLQFVPAIVPFDRDRSVSRVLEISLVPDGSRNGSNPDLSVVVLNRLTLR